MAPMADAVPGTMIRSGSVLILCLMAMSASAEQALVRNHQNTALEVGQGYLTHYAGTCYLLLPAHVIEEAGETAALLGEGVSPLLGETAPPQVASIKRKCTPL